MSEEQLIIIEDFCTSHEIEISFIESLEKTGLIRFVRVKEGAFLRMDQLRQIEKYIHFYYDLQINLEGIETIDHLLAKITGLQNRVNELNNKVRFYEGSGRD